MLTTGKKDIPNFDLNYHFSWQEAQFAKTERLIILSAILAQCSAWTLNLRIFFSWKQLMFIKASIILKLIIIVIIIIIII